MRMTGITQRQGKVSGRKLNRLPRKRLVFKTPLECIYALDDPHDHDQTEEPQCGLVAGIRVIDGLGEKLAAHSGSFSGDQLKQLR
jgi:hypothetical protein